MSAPVLAAAAQLVDAFARHDVDAYFARFRDDATFLLPDSPRLHSRAEYRAAWEGWEAEGFRVESCASDEQRVDLLAPGVAVFTHRVTTLLAGQRPSVERETIVFVRDDDGTWRAGHEHLSAWQ